jgi:hypothetical protein
VLFCVLKGILFKGISNAADHQKETKAILIKRNKDNTDKKKQRQY